MRCKIEILLSLCLCILWLLPPALASSMKSSAPEKMLPSRDAKNMRACDEKAMRENVPMDQKAVFVKNCMAEMKKK